MARASKVTVPLFQVTEMDLLEHEVLASLVRCADSAKVKSELKKIGMDVPVNRVGEILNHLHRIMGDL